MIFFMEPTNPTESENNKNIEERSYEQFRATRRAASFFFFSLVGLLFSTMILPFIFAPLGIFYAYLAKGKRAKNDIVNNILIFFCAMVLVINIAFCGYAVYSINHDTIMHKRFDAVSEQLYGVSFEEYMQQSVDAVRNAGGTVQ